MSIAIKEQAIAPDPDSQVTADVRQFGVSQPIPLLSQAECNGLLRHLDNPNRPAPLDWWKGRAVTDRAIYDVATRPQLIALLRPLLGEDIILWGATVVCRRPGTLHAWHTDMESTDPDSRVVTAWIGLHNASENSGLRLVAGSHQFGGPVQEVLAGLHEDRETIADERMTEIAQAMDPAARIVQPDAQDGQVVLFDGRIWHSGRNDRATEIRTALLLQYAAADMAIPMPAGPGYEWPLKFAANTRVPAILVSGTSRDSPNRLVPPPPPSSGAPMITRLTRTVALPLAEDPVKRWRPYRQFRGPTSTLAAMSCHISVLSAGHRPHPPHIHQEEELLIVLDGAVEIELADDKESSNSRRHPMKPGMFSYYPATQHHTIHNTSVMPATYLMFKWHAGIAGSEAPLSASIFEYDAAVVPAEPTPMAKKLLFQQATHALGKLHAHLTTLQPGAGYEPHADPYDVAIVLLSGEIETVGKRVRPLGLVYYSAGVLHGMRNVGTTPATYLVFEFHSTATVAQRQWAEQCRRQAQQAEQQRRKLEKQQRKRGFRGLIRKLAKAVRKLAR
jgi:uncharacterized cupin superfamily protein